MKKGSLVTVASVAMLLGSVAASADPVKDWPGASANGSADWRGFYVGVNAGASRLSGDVSTTGTNAGAFTPALFAEILRNSVGSLTSSNRFTGGIQAGYNFQWGYVVYGVETDYFNFLKTEAKRDVTIPSTVGATFAHHKDIVRTDWLYTLRPRLGVVAGPFLFYATGGLALTKFRYAHEYNGSLVGAVEETSTSKTKAGWTAGAGIEWPFGNWSLKAEYLYADFGSVHVDGVYQGTVAVPQPFSHTADNLTVQIVRGGINYRFGGGPLAAADPGKDWPGVVAASHDWSGFYVGLNAGGARLTADVAATGINVGGFGGGLFYEILHYSVGSLTSRNRFTGGVQAGYNFQWGNIVYGIETDFNSLKTNATREVTVPSAFAANFTHHKDTVSTDWLYTLRPRLGVAVGPYLFYATGGLALTRIKYAHAFNVATVGGAEATSASKTKATWTAGGGIEVPYGNWSLKAEYLYADFGSIEMDGVYRGPGVGFAQPFNHTADNLIVQIVRAGINYRFP
jgi:outer membrane immunogenic protein